MNRELEAIFQALEAGRENPENQALIESYESRLDEVQARLPDLDRVQLRQTVGNSTLNGRNRATSTHRFRRRLDALRQPTNLFATAQALWPPKPNELLMIASTLHSRAVFGT